MFKKALLSLALIATTSTAYAAWYLDRDNSMISAEPEVGNAMFMLSSKAGKTQAVQVCEGVFLATAHGALNTPDAVEMNGRPLGDPYNQRIRLYPYPVTSKKRLHVTDFEVQFFAPRLENPALWSSPGKDYVFIKVNPVEADAYARESGLHYSSQTYVPIAMATDSELVRSSDKGEIDVHLYRGLTRFNTDESGVPDFDRNTWATSLAELEKIYSEPQKVEQACTLRQSPRYLHVASDCPSENSVSGSAYISRISDVFYLLGMHTRGIDRSAPSLNELNGGSSMLVSQAFCADFERACGQPCATLVDVTP